MESKIRTEVHAHTIASHHAYSTLGELIATCKEKGITLLAITDHGPAISDGAHPWHFSNLKVLPHKDGSVHIVRGAEVNIIDFEGNVDLDQKILEKLEWVIASIHPPVIEPATKEDHTRAYIKLLENPAIDALGHSGFDAYRYDIDAVLETAKKYNKVIEINNHTFSIRQKSVENCFKIARRCAELGVKVVLSTDAHSVYDIGDTELCWKLAMEAGIREEQIVNLTAERFIEHLCARRGFDKARFDDTRPGIR